MAAVMMVVVFSSGTGNTQSVDIDKALNNLRLRTHGRIGELTSINKDIKKTVGVPTDVGLYRRSVASIVHTISTANNFHWSLRNMLTTLQYVDPRKKLAYYKYVAKQLDYISNMLKEIYQYINESYPYLKDMAVLNCANQAKNIIADSIYDIRKTIDILKNTTK
jgi:hypothetical protein